MPLEEDSWTRTTATAADNSKVWHLFKILRCLAPEEVNDKCALQVRKVALVDRYEERKCRGCVAQA
jgi:hypothetical protein